MFDHIDYVRFCESMVVLFFGIGLHEYAHCKFADLAGDPTPRFYGRMTLNLFKHFDPMGVMMIVITSLTGFGIGWGNPAPMNPEKMRDPRWDFFIAVLAGPLSNVVQAFLYMLALRFCLVSRVDIGDIGFQFLILGAVINLSLCFFNLIPLGPLDGHWLVGLLMPEKTRLGWYQFNRSIGSFLMVALILSGQFMAQGGGHGPTYYLIFKPAATIVRSVTGIKID